MSSTERNREYYDKRTPGQEDYWRLMAAPRHRGRVILRLIEELAPQSLVELGCGDGRLLREVRQQWPAMRLAGIDLSEAQIEANRERDSSIEWRAADLQQSLAQSDSFDVVVAAEIIEHLDDPSAFLRNARALGRNLILTTQSGPIGETERRVGHTRHFTAAAMRSLLDETGWRPQRVWNEGFPFHDLSKWLANVNADASMRRFGEQHYGPLERFVSWGLRVAFRFNSRKRGAQLFVRAEAA